MRLLKPTKGLVTSFFSPNRKNPVTGIYRPHGGVDFGWHGTDDTVVAAAGGVVRVPKYHSGAGNYLYIEHGNGYTTVYMHLKRITVRSGQRVSQGQAIGIKGTTGNSTGVHLHFELLQHSTYTNLQSKKRNPLIYMVDPTTKEWQGMLKELGFYNGAVDGIYGDGTIRAVMNFQKRYKLSADGVCGRTTYSTIKREYAKLEDKNKGELTMSQYTELKRLIVAQDKEISKLKKDTKDKPVLLGHVKEDMDKAMKFAYDEGLFSVDHSKATKGMELEQALRLLINLVGRMADKGYLTKK